MGYHPGDAMAGKKDVKKTVQFDEDEVAQISDSMVEHDASFTEVVRACVQVALPLLNDRPSLIKIISGLPRNENRELSR